MSGPRQSTAVDEQIARSIERRRLAQGITQADLAKRLGISMQQVQKYETGQNRVAGSRLYAIAEALHCSPADLFPPVTWGAAPDLRRASLEACADLLAQAQPAIAEALKLARAA